MAQERTIRRVSRSGFTLLEVMIYMVVMAILGVPLMVITVTAFRASAEGDMICLLQERNRSILQRISSEYRNSLNGTAIFDQGGRRLRFTSYGGFEGAVVAGPVIGYELRLSPDEKDNGLDDNQNGIVDEGILVRVDYDREEEIILAGNLSLEKSSFTPNGNGATIRFTTSGKNHLAKETTDVQRTLDVYPQN